MSDENVVEAKKPTKPEVSECDTASEASYAPSTSSHKPSGIRPPSVRIGRLCTSAHCTPKASHPPLSESKNNEDINSSKMRRHSDEFSRSHLADVDEESEADLVMDKMSRSSKSRSPDIWKSSRYERKSANGSLSSDLYWEATGRRRSSDQGIVLTTDTDSFIIGQRVWVGGVRPGHIAYIGETHFAPGDWAGVVLDEPSGKNDGCVSGKRYFQCEPKRGIFSRLTRLTREPLLTADSTDDLYRSPSRTPASPVRTISPPSSVRNSVTPSRAGTKGGMHVGDRVIVSSGFGSRPGVLKYIGETSFAPGNWCGVELDDPTGKNNGSVDGIRYFECADKYGIFVPLAKVTLSPTAKKTFTRLPRSNSKESLTSIGTLGSMASTNTSRLRMGANAQRLSSSTKPIITPKNTFSLQDVLREKQNHIEQLLAEKDLDRQDAEIQSMMYQKDINELRQKVADLEGRLKEEKRKNEDLQFTVDEAQFCGDELSAQSQEYKERITKLEEELAHSKTSSIATEPDGDSGQLKELTEKVEELKKSLAAREEELKNVREEEKERSNKILELQQKLIEAESTLDIKVSSLSVSENCLKEEIQLLSTQNDELRDEMEKQKQSFVSLVEAQKNLQNENEILKQKLAEGGKTSSGMQEIIANLEKEKEEIPRLKTLLAEAEVSLKKNAQTIQEFEKKFREEEEKITEVTKSLEALRRSENTLKHEIQEKSSKIQELEKEITDVAASRKIAETEKLSNEGKIREFEVIIESLKKQISEANSATTSSREEVDSVRKILSNQEQSTGELRAECDALRKKLHDTEAALEEKLRDLARESEEKSQKIHECEDLKEKITLNATKYEQEAQKNATAMEAIKEEVRKLSESLKVAENEKESLKKLLEAGEEAKKSLEENVENQKRQIEGLTTNLTELDGQKSTLQENFNQLDLTHGDLVRKFKVLEEKCTQMTTEKQSLQQELTAVRNSSVDVNSEVTRLTQELEMKKANLESLSESSTATKLSLETKIQELSQLVERLQGELDTVGSQKINRENELNGELARTKELMQNEMEATKKKFQEEREKMIQEINAKIDEADATRANLTASIARLEESISGLQKELENSRNHEKVTERELEEARKQFDGLERNLTKDLEASRAKIATLELSAASRDSSQTELLQRIAEKDSALAEVRDERDTLKVEVGALRENFERQIREIVELKSTAEAATKASEAESRKTREIDEKLRDMEDEQVDLVDRNEQMSVKIAEMEAEREALVKSLEEATVRSESQAREQVERDRNIQDLQGERDAVREELKATVAHVADLKNQLEAKTTEQAALEGAIAELKGSLGAAEVTIREKEAKLVHIVTESEGFQNSLREDLARKVDASEKLEKKVRDLDDTVRNLKESLESANKEKAKAEEAARTFEASVMNLKKSSDEVDSSRAKQDAQIAQLSKQLGELKENISRRDERIGQLEKQENLLKSEVGMLQNRMGVLQATLDDRELQLKVTKSQLEAAKSNPVAAQAVGDVADDTDAGAQINFLNSIIADMQRKNTELVARVHLLETAPAADSSHNGLNLEMPVRRKPAPRLFCDICDIFDAHDTEDCPLQASDSPVPPEITRNPGERVIPPARKYCESCEVFGHEIGECDNDESF